MNRKTKSLIKRLSPVRIYKDDLEEILDAFDDSYKTTISNAGYNFESLDEFLKQQDDLEFIDSIELRFLHQETYESINIEVTPKEVSFYSTNDRNPIGTHILEKLKKHIHWFSKPFPLLIDFMLICILNIAIPSTIYLYSKNIYLTCFILLVLTFASPVLIIEHILLCGKSRIYLIKKNQRKSFFRRNKDQLILGLILIILGSVLTLLSQWAMG